MKEFSDVRNQWFIDQVNGLRGDQGLALAEIARRLEVKPQYLTPIMAGQRNASEKLVLKLCQAFDINQNDLLSKMKINEYEIKQDAPPSTHVTDVVSEYVNGDRIPLIPFRAIANIDDLQSVEIERKYLIPDFTSRGAEFLVSFWDTSMLPKYFKGDLLAFKRIQSPKFYQWGHIYLLSTDQGPIVCRLYSSPKDGYLECRPDNMEKYPPFEIHKSAVKSLAIFVGAICFG